MGSLTPIGSSTPGSSRDALRAVDEKAAGEGFFATRLEALVNWGRKNSLWPMPLGLSCCGIELMAMIGPKFDISRFGAEAARFSPRQCDLLIVAGTLTWKMAQACRQIYDQMPDPKWVIAMGVCSSSGGMYDSYAVVQGVDSILPVDVYVPGCPPRPDAVIDAILKLQKRIARERPFRERVRAEQIAREDEIVKQHGTRTLLYAPNRSVPRTPLDRHPHDPRNRSLAEPQAAEGSEGTSTGGDNGRTREAAAANQPGRQPAASHVAESRALPVSRVLPGSGPGVTGQPGPAAGEQAGARSRAEKEAEKGSEDGGRPSKDRSKERSEGER